VAVVVLVLAGAGGFAAVRLRAPLPALVMSPVASSEVRLAGKPAALPWPAHGQAAMVVEGVGTAGVHGQSGPVPIGSVAKVMTALVILRDHPLVGNAPGPSLTVTPADEQAYAAALGTGDSMVPVYAGERITEREALEALMVPSADNIADMLAVWDAGSVPAFVAKMDRQALAWGATHTHYADASGLSAQTTSTATDQVLVGERALHEHVLAAVVAEPKALLPVAGVVTNYNSLLGSDGVIGIKTGSTRAAGGSLLFAARTRVGGRPLTVVGAVLGQAVGIAPLSALQVALDGSRALVRAVTSSLRAQRVVVPGAVVSTGVTQWGPSTTARVSNAVTVLGFPGSVVQVASLGCAVGVPASVGEPCGGVTVTWGDPLSGRSSTTVGATLDRGIPQPSWTQRLLQGD
jgi:D-alanyl-D-alanine carboxypeptidase (penicillin-binding protein 5/6)